MTHIRISIANLLVIVLVLAVGFAALRESNDLWESAVFTLTTSVLMVSILLAIHRTQPRRAFWLGFALCGSTYLALSLFPSIEPRLITTKVLAYLDSKVPGRSPAIMVYTNLVINSGIDGEQVQSAIFGADRNPIAMSSQGQGWIRDVTYGTFLGGWGGTTENFMRIGHTLVALLAGWFGGYLSRRLYQCSRTQMPTTNTSGGTTL